MRRGEWKLHGVRDSKELYHLAKDPSEQTNLARRQPEIVSALAGAFDKWIEPMADPITGGTKRWDSPPKKRDTSDRERERQQKRLERKKQRAAERNAKQKNEGATNP